MAAVMIATLTPASLVIAVAVAACGRGAAPQPSRVAPSVERPSAEPSVEPPAGSAGVDDAGTCPPDEPAPTSQRPAREGPFVDVLPREQVPLTRSLPDRDVPFDGIVCQAGQEVWRDAEGRVRVCTVARAVSVSGIDIPAHAYSHFFADGRPFQTRLAHPQVLHTSNGTSVSCAADFVVLSKVGALEDCQLAATATYGSVTARAGESVAFHPEGELAAAVIDQPFVVGALGVTFPAGTRLRFYQNGALAGGEADEPIELAGYALRWEFSLHDNRRLAFFTLDAARTIQGNAFEPWTKVALRPDGSLRYAQYEVDSGFMPHGERWTDTAYVRYDCHGAVTSRNVEHWQAEHPPPRRP